MQKNILSSKKPGFISLILLTLVVLFVGVLAIGWNTSVNIKKLVATNASVMNIDSSALTELERLRNLAESQLSNSRAYFLLGSKSVYDRLKQDKQRLIEGMAKFVKDNPSPQIAEIATAVETIEKQEDDIFAQAVAFREKKEESKIVAQFYQSKTNPLLAQFNEQFDKIGKIQNASLEAARARAQQAGADAEAQIPKNMIWFMGAISAIFASTVLLVIWLLKSRRDQYRVRDRLYESAQRAALDRDEVIAAISHDLKDSIKTLEETAQGLSSDARDSVVSVAQEMKAAISNIVDQKRDDMGELTLRLEQLPLSNILEESQAMLLPLAKKQDITLQFDPVNPSLLTYADRERVLRVLSNLVGNAIKFSPRNSRVQVKAKSDAQFANITVIDGGPVIPESRHASLFDNFWQAARTAAEGPGIGLAVVKTIVEAHGGTVRVERSFIGGGNAFTFSLPRRRPAGAVLKKPSSPAASKRFPTTPVEETQDGPTA